MDFFVIGIPKSGTTWLQMLLDAHPDISCRAEDELIYFISEIPIFLKRYNEIRETVNERTAKQELYGQFKPDSDTTPAFEFFVEYLRFITARDTGKKIIGTNDNNLIHNLKAVHSLFPESKFIHIIRDIRDVISSGWYHNIRIEGEESFVGRVHSLEDFALESARSWVEYLSAMESIKDRCIYIRFCDLKAMPVSTVEAVLSFLGADPSQAKRCLSSTDFQKLSAGGNQFFHRGERGGWKDILDQEMVGGVVEIAGDKLKQYGFMED